MSSSDFINKIKNQNFDANHCYINTELRVEKKTVLGRLWVWITHPKQYDKLQVSEKIADIFEDTMEEFSTVEAANIKQRLSLLEVQFLKHDPKDKSAIHAEFEKAKEAIDLRTSDNPKRVEKSNKSFNEGNFNKLLRECKSIPGVRYIIKQILSQKYGLTIYALLKGGDFKYFEELKKTVEKWGARKKGNEEPLNRLASTFTNEQLNEIFGKAYFNGDSKNALLRVKMGEVSLSAEDVKKIVSDS